MPSKKFSKTVESLGREHSLCKDCTADLLFDWLGFSSFAYDELNADLQVCSNPKQSNKRSDGTVILSLVYAITLLHELKKTRQKSNAKFSKTDGQQILDETNRGRKKRAFTKTLFAKTLERQRKQIVCVCVCVCVCV